jgi:hypothetical protein
MKIIKLNIFLLLILTNSIWSKTYVVAESGGDYTKIQDAINVAVAGDTIFVKEKSNPYFEEITFKSSGNSNDGYIVLSAFPNEHPVIDGTGFSGGDNWPQGLIKIINKSYIKVIGFEIRNLITSDNDWFPAGIWIRGKSKHIEILNNKIHHIEHNNADGGAHGIAVYGTSSSKSISDILIEGNEIYNCKLAWSESLVLNGNVENFIIKNNIVHDNNNIAFDFIGHEGECSNPDLDQARNGLVTGNIAYNIDSRTNPSYEGEGSADGFYVDGGKDIIFERNLAYNCNIGFEIASEHGGKSTSGIIIRNNFIKDNISLGLAIGGYDEQRGSADNCYIVNNTFYKNNNADDSWGAEILVNYYCNDITIANNIVYSKNNVTSVENTSGTGSNKLFFNNLYYTEGTPKWLWGNGEYTNFENYKTASATETGSVFSNPEFVDIDNDDISLANNSPAIENGKNFDISIIGNVDYYSKPRLTNANVDIGATEYEGVVSVNNSNVISEFSLSQNYPNPFNPTTAIQYSTPPHPSPSQGEGARVGFLVTLKVFDILGKEVATLVNKEQTPGNYKVTFNGTGLPSGVYFYNLTVKKGTEKIFGNTKMMIMLK